MSFDLAVWYTGERLSDEDAATVYTALGTPASGVTQHSGIDAFYAELTARFPEIDTVPDDRIDDHDHCPYGLALYNPQQGRVHYPGGLSEHRMDLELESGKNIRGVTADELLSCVEGEEFAILSAHPNTYLQCAEQKEPPYEYILEYQDGSLEKHYRATDEQITLERVLSAFLKYLRGDGSWLTDFQWEKMELEG